MNPILLLAALLPAAAAAAAEHPLFEPFPRSTLEDQAVKEFDEYEVPTGPLSGGRHVKAEALEGRVTTLSYRNPPERATLELMRTYEAALARSGFTPLYSCKGKVCGQGCVQDKGLGWHCVGTEDRYYAGRLPRGEGDAYVALLVLPEHTRVSIVEVRGMAERAPAAADAPPSPRSGPAEAAPPPSPGASKEVTSGIIQGLGALGIQARIGSSGTDADIVVEGTTETRPVETAGDKRWKFARSTASITLKDGRTGRAFLSFESSDRQASGDYKEAARRSRVALAKKVADQVHSAITEYFENQ